MLRAFFMDPVFRISRGAFPPQSYEAVRTAFAASQAILEPAMRRLPGLRKSFAAIDADSSSIVFVSFWDDLQSAQQLDNLKEMQTSGRELAKLGVQFERPVINYETLWRVYYR
jgi:hypothetical protein